MQSISIEKNVRNSYKPLHVKSRDSLYFGNTKEMKFTEEMSKLRKSLQRFYFEDCMHVKLKRLLAIVKISNSLYKIVKSIDS